VNPEIILLVFYQDYTDNQCCMFACALAELRESKILKLKPRPGGIRPDVSVRVDLLNTVNSLQQIACVLPYFKFFGLGVIFRCLSNSLVKNCGRVR